MLPSDDGSLRKRLVSISETPIMDRPFRDDLRSGLSALPEWMRVIVRDLPPAGERWGAIASKESEALQTRTGIGSYHQEGEGFEQPDDRGFSNRTGGERRRSAATLFVGAADRLRTNERINNA